ncbi:MAG: hypothetical protein Q8P76_01885 [bacterium]|nr:hypothetical protein [bacterium]
MEAYEAPDQYDLLLNQIASDEFEEKKEQGAFLFIFQDDLDPQTGLISGTAHAVPEWGQWSEKSQQVIQRCADKGLLEIEYLKPTEKGFQLRLLAQQRLVNVLLPPADEFRREYFEELPKIPILRLTQKGMEYLRDLVSGPS